MGDRTRSVSRSVGGPTRGLPTTLPRQGSPSRACRGRESPTPSQPPQNFSRSSFPPKREARSFGGARASSRFFSSSSTLLEVEEERGARRGGGGHSHTSLITGTGAPQHHRNGGRRKVFSFLPLQLFPSVGTNKRCCKREEALGESGRRRDRERRRCACLDFFLLLLPAFLLRPLPPLLAEANAATLFTLFPLPKSKKYWKRGNGIAEGMERERTKTTQQFYFSLHVSSLPREGGSKRKTATTK